MTIEDLLRLLDVATYTPAAKAVRLMRLKVVDEKLCSKCKLTKPFEEFPKHKERVDGHGEVCQKCKSALYREKYAEKERADRMRRYYADHEKSLREMRDWQNANREVLRKSSRKWRASNPDSQARATHAWGERNPERRRLYAANRNAAKKMRTPPWLTPEDMRNIADFYYLAAALSEASGIPHEVDHIVPIQGRSVSGLHVPWNLQILTESENCAKGNRYES